MQKYILLFNSVLQLFAKIIVLLCKIIILFNKKRENMIKSKLIKVRNRRGFSQEYMADTLNMDVSNYCRKESGQIKISAEQWQILAKKLDVPLEDIYEADENLIFVFNDNSTGNGNIVNNYSLPQDVLDMYKKHINVLEQEIYYLKELLKKAEK